MPLVASDWPHRTKDADPLAHEPGARESGSHILENTPSQQTPVFRNRKGLAGRLLSLTNPTIREAKVERVFWNRAADRSCHPLQLGVGCLAYVQMPVS